IPAPSSYRGIAPSPNRWRGINFMGEIGAAGDDRDANRHTSDDDRLRHLLSRYPDRLRARAGRPVTEAEIRRIVSETVTETLMRLGIEADEPLDVQRDMQHLRAWRTSTET